MRHVVVDHYRRRHRLKRGGEHTRVNLDVGSIPNDSFEKNVLALNEALEQFELVHPTKAELVKLRFFVGMPPIVYELTTRSGLKCLTLGPTLTWHPQPSRLHLHFKNEHTPVTQ